jgi:hypothetical protein
MSELTSFQTVQTWMRSAKFEASDPRLDLFDEFCQLVERTPDEMVSECLKIVQAGQFKLRGKTRRHYVERIEEFEQGHGGRTRGNVIRSFFIHNGIPIQPPILT